MQLLPDKLRTELVRVLSEAHREVQAARGLFRMELGDQALELPVEGWGWQAVPGVPGVEMCALPPAHWPADAPEHTDYFAVRGPQGARSPERIRLPQAVRLEVLCGSVLFWKESAPGYAEYLVGDVFTAQPGEAHAFLAVTDFLNRVGFTPRLTQP